MVIYNNMISLRSAITKKVLLFFLINKNEEKYVNEFARLLQVDPKNLDTKLKEFEKIGLLKSVFKGKQRYYSLNKNFTLLKKYMAIVQQTIGLEQLLKNTLEKIKGIEEVYIFGSYAKNTFDNLSDIDLLIIGNHKALEAEKVITSIEHQLNREINIIDMSKNDLISRKKQKEPFITDIFSHPLIKVL